MRRRHWLGAALAAATLVGGTAASAQTAPAPDNETICLSVLRLWPGSNEDVARIATVPVPESYRQAFFEGPCNYLSKGDLITWHLAFGDEASTTRALAFLDKNMAGPEPYTPDLGKRIAATKGNPDFAPLLKLADQASGYLFLAQMYVKAADFYRSPALLARAQHYAGPAIAAGAAANARVASNPGDSNAQNVAMIAGGDGPADELELHLVVTRAAITRTTKDLAAVEAMLKAKGDPFYATAADEAYEHGDFCDVGDRPDLAAYVKACEDGNFDRRAIAWLRCRAQLDILRIDLAGDPAKARDLSNLQSMWAILRILSREARAHGDPSGFRRYTPEADAEVALRLARAEASVRLAGLVSGPDSNYTIGGAYSSAMDDLMLAEPLAPPATVPGRFRQIATRFLDAHAKAAALDKRRGSNGWTGNPMVDREAAYFRAMLPLLKPIAEAR